MQTNEEPLIISEQCKFNMSGLNWIEYTNGTSCTFPNISRGKDLSKTGLFVNSQESSGILLDYKEIKPILVDSDALSMSENKIRDMKSFSSVFGAIRNEYDSIKYEDYPVCGKVNMIKNNFVTCNTNRVNNGFLNLSTKNIIEFNVIVDKVEDNIEFITVESVNINPRYGKNLIDLVCSAQFIERLNYNLAMDDWSSNLSNILNKLVKDTRIKYRGKDITDKYEKPGEVNITFKYIPVEELANDTKGDIFARYPDIVVYNGKKLNPHQVSCNDELKDIILKRFKYYEVIFCGNVIMDEPMISYQKIADIYMNKVFKFYTDEYIQTNIHSVFKQLFPAFYSVITKTNSFKETYIMKVNALSSLVDNYLKLTEKPYPELELFFRNSHSFLGMLNDMFTRSTNHCRRTNYFMSLLNMGNANLNVYNLCNLVAYSQLDLFENSKKPEKMDKIGSWDEDKLVRSIITPYEFDKEYGKGVITHSISGLHAGSIYKNNKIVEITEGIRDNLIIEKCNCSSIIIKSKDIEESILEDKIAHSYSILEKDDSKIDRNMKSFRKRNQDYEKSFLTGDIDKNPFSDSEGYLALKQVIKWSKGINDCTDKGLNLIGQLLSSSQAIAWSQVRMDEVGSNSLSKFNNDMPNIDTSSFRDRLCKIGANLDVADTTSQIELEVYNHLMHSSGFIKSMEDLNEFILRMSASLKDNKSEEFVMNYIDNFMDKKDANVLWGVKSLSLIFMNCINRSDFILRNSTFLDVDLKTVVKDNGVCLLELGDIKDLGVKDFYDLETRNLFYRKSGLLIPR